jgi:hypothetical protein
VTTAVNQQYFSQPGSIRAKEHQDMDIQLYLSGKNLRARKRFLGIDPQDDLYKVSG